MQIKIFAYSGISTLHGYCCWFFRGILSLSRKLKEELLFPHSILPLSPLHWIDKSMTLRCNCTTSIQSVMAVREGKRGEIELQVEHCKIPCEL